MEGDAGDEFPEFVVEDLSPVFQKIPLRIHQNTPFKRKKILLAPSQIRPRWISFFAPQLSLVDLLLRLQIYVYAISHVVSLSSPSTTY